MIVVKYSAAQGDVLFKKVDAIPEGYREKVGHDVRIMSHSETGHHHVAEGGDLMVWEAFEPKDPALSLVCYLQVGENCDFSIQHLRLFDTHDPFKLESRPGDIWAVHRQREHIPEGWRRVAD